jgi:hypothetical protein
VKREVIIACVGLAVVTSCATQRGRNELPSSSPRAAEIHKNLNRTMIPTVDLENVSLEEALKVWAELSRENHPLHFDFKHVISYPMTYSKQTTAQGGTHTAATAVPPRSPPKVTVRRKNITSGHLLDEICHQANFVWTIMGRVIVIKPSGSPPPETTP